MIAKLPMPPAIARSRRRVSPFRVMPPPSSPARPRGSGDPVLRKALDSRLRGNERSTGLLPVAVNPVPLIEPFALQLHELLVVRNPHLHRRGIEALRIERRLLQRREITKFLDLERLAFLRHAPIEKQLRGVWIRSRL